MREPADVRAAVRGWMVGGRPLDPAESGGLHRAVLVEGISDVAALETLAARSGRPLHRHGVALIPMGGATNVRHYAALLGPEGLGLERQPAQRERRLAAQLRRFMGTTSGRKRRYAAAMCAALAENCVPTPLAAVLASTDQ